MVLGDAQPLPGQTEGRNSVHLETISPRGQVLVQNQSADLSMYDMPRLLLTLRVRREPCLSYELQSYSAHMRAVLGDRWN